MIQNPRDLIDTVAEAKRAANRLALLAQGMARAVLRRSGALPEGAPNFPGTLTTSLLDFGFGLLTAALLLRRSIADKVDVADAFRQAAEALDAVTRNDVIRPESDFIRVVTAASFHLGGYAARAYTALPDVNHGNNSVVERVLICLISRDLLNLRGIASSFVQTDGSENAVIAASSEVPTDVLVERMLTGQFCRALSLFTTALSSGDRGTLGSAEEMLASCLSVAEELGLLQLWWIVRLTTEFLDDLWGASLHNLLPLDVPGSDHEEWEKIRRQYIDNLVNRQRSEAEFWPSQIAALNLVVGSEENAVIALPTGAGKTRIAELAILKTLSRKRRVIYVTPLRALSAQVERGLREAFRGAKVAVSAVYSAIGAQAADIISMREADVVVMTPEKLQFAIRLDPSILDDVGLIVLDEGHMIGLSQREVRYEILVQKLLRRVDANDRRLICLSAALPSGDDLVDFTTWLTGSADRAVDIQWRPTQLRFGDVIWRTDRGWLTFYSAERADGYFAPTFIEQRQVPTPAGQRMRPFPRTRQELIVSVAARYASDGQSVLVYCPQRNSVESLTNEAAVAVEQGGVSFPRRESPAMLRAVRVAREWLGGDHVAVKGLIVGVGMHHGDLPLPVREAMEGLFKGGDIKVLISSPTLAQGLNITVSAVIFSSVYRYKKEIPVGEFLNVCGRAGRPYAAAEGHVLYCGYPQPTARDMNRSLTAWRRLVRQVGSRKLRSGIFELVAGLLREMQLRQIADFEQLEEYIVNLRAGTDDQRDRADEIEASTDTLDESILALVGSEDIGADDLAVALDTVLQSSLWSLELAREAEAQAELYSEFLVRRAERVWFLSTPEQRQRFYLTGLNLKDGLTLDELLPQLAVTYAAVEAACGQGDSEALVAAAVELLGALFTVRCFRGDSELPANWEHLLSRWLLGMPLVDGALVDLGTLEFLQGTCGFNAVWGIEAVRAVVARIEGMEPTEYPASQLSTLIEYGVPSVSAALLLKAGLESRLAASAVAHLLPVANSIWDLLTWLDMVPTNYFDDVQWPSADTRIAWQDFIGNHRGRYDGAFGGVIDVEWFEDAPANGTTVDVYATSLFAELRVYASDAERPIGRVLLDEAATSVAAFRAVLEDGRLLKLAM